MENFPFSFVSSSVSETQSYGKRFAFLLYKGSVVALRGGLGTGKTYFTKGIALGLGVTEEVTSPTYTLIREYEGRLPLYHIDAYRLTGDDDFSALGAEELLYGDGVTVIEWSERIPNAIPLTAISVEIEIVEDGKRKISVSGAKL
jgi:tRNA threonylcarbamoyladenosine biosynthesis protein TsaE